MKRNKAFTLAEVLITLGIIGVVAALTIPTLVNQYKKQVYYTQFRKAASQLEQALKMYQIDHGCDGNVSACGTIEYNDVNYYVELIAIPNFVEDLSSYFNGSILIDNENYENVCSYEKIPVKGSGNYNSYCYDDLGVANGAFAFKTKDGMLYNFGTDESYGNGSIVDINGPEKGPNEIGRDIFIFYLKYFSDNPSTYSGIVWGGNPNYDNLPCLSDVNERYGCANKLLTEGKMNY